MGDERAELQDLKKKQLDAVSRKADAKDDRRREKKLNKKYKSMYKARDQLKLAGKELIAKLAAHDSAQRELYKLESIEKVATDSPKYKTAKFAADKAKLDRKQAGEIFPKQEEGLNNTISRIQAEIAAITAPKGYKPPSTSKFKRGVSTAWNFVKRKISKANRNRKINQLNKEIA